MKKKIVSGLLVAVMLATGVAYASGKKVEASVSSIKYFFNGVEKAPVGSHILIHDNTTYVPLRFVAETLGANVEYDKNTNSVYITDKSQPQAQAQVQTKAPATVSYEDGIYRGTFDYEGIQQVAVQFELKNNVIQNIRFAHLAYKGVDYRAEKEDAKIIGLRTQHEDLINYLVGKDIRVSLKDLYDPGKIVTSQVDAMTGATLRSGKIISAIRDSLNRGVYSYPKK
ncbi:copper amine oxidase N-terminal domain-containing protein [Serpentinicella alkaliphila]|uniref:FMN-binding protein n=1 Tax=Serpentinicella alkaliphila TaxID=1734049 RepID=A0A4R2TZV3_9FIRM|nr:copper amine oxidase N-terminal domain-containing protein [Serpentinicella alkaliphila]QUH25243.1 copper amine oxidase N-terminal domain-containing protein [Serpentinicella alkaliphila]TCQ07055.1 FMN-binding protein [Serpentinicella alkaliphila]